MRQRVLPARLALALLASISLGCAPSEFNSTSNSPSPPPPPPPPPPAPPPAPALPELSGLIVSNPLPLGSASLRSGRAPVNDTAAVTGVYVSMPPQSFSGAERVVIRNGANPEVTVTVVDGGWDPVGVRAREGDVLRLLVTGSFGMKEFGSPVPKRKGPIIVRTDPRPGKRDVPLNATLLVVFSEPMDPGSITSATVQLLRNGVTIGGSVALRPGEKWNALLTPAALEPGSDYVLRITGGLGGVSDQDADTLGRSVDVPFTTEPPPPIPPAGRVAFVRADGDDHHLYVLNLSGMGVTQLTTGAVRDDQPAWAPDGGQLAFTRDLKRWWETDPNRAVIRGEIWLVDSDGSGLHRLTDGHNPAWARDSVGRLAFFRGGNIVIANADGSGAERVIQLPPFDIDLGSLSWSSDGRTFVFHASNGDWLTLPDGSVMWYETETILFINADGSGLRQLNDGGIDAQASPSWSPDSRLIAYWSYFGGLTVFPVGGGQRVSLLAQSNWSDHFGWSPDGSLIVTAYDGGTVRGQPAGQSALYLVPAVALPGWRSPFRLPGTEGAWHPTWTR